MKLPGLDKLGSVGLVGERKAISLLCLGFYVTLFFMIGLSARTELPEWVPVFVGMFLVYVTAFMGVAAEWFWGRWFATGLGYWGCTMAVMAFVTTRSFPTPMVVFGVMHALIAACLQGEKMAAVFDAKPDWRVRWKLDEQGVLRVRRSVTRAASSLPALIMFALAPREGQNLAIGMDPASVALLSVGALAVVGFLATQRTWALMAFAGVGALTIARAFSPFDLYSVYDATGWPDTGLMIHGAGAFAGAMMVAASLPFLAPMARFLRHGR